MSDDNIKFGGGSGGGNDKQDDTRQVDGTWGITANQVLLTSRMAIPPAVTDPCMIVLEAIGIDMTGKVNLRGLEGVRITAGPPPMPATSSSSTNGVEIEVFETQNVTIKRGLIDGVDQKIEMTPTGITIDGGSMPITIQSLTEIKLSVAGGMSSITLGPQGIQIQGVPIVQIQGGPLVQIN